MQTPKILILGGTSFMGKALVSLLSNNHPDHQIHLINRGKKYWNNEVYQQHPNIHHHYGDRKDKKQMTKMIEYVQTKIGITENNPWKAVIDFSSFKWREVQSIAKGLKGRTVLYIFISSDSLYNCSPFKGVPFTEEDFNIEEEHKNLSGKKIKDKYGYNKLKCEIYLYKTKCLPFVAFRLPDVLGPYENTSRYWCTFEWVRRSQKYPIEICQRDKTLPLCFVSSKDIASQIIELIKNCENIPKCRSYNLCCNEKVTFKEFIERIGQKMIPPVVPVLKEIQGKQNKGLFPSTEFICIDNSLAKKEIGWNPASLDECITESNKFFAERACKYQSEKKEMFREFKTTVIEKD